MKLKILVVTACGKSKHNEAKPAYLLYRSPRIKAVYNRRSGCDMAILSAKYGLIDSDIIIEPYEAIMTEERAKKLIPQVVEKIKSYDTIIYYRGGAGRAYLTCLNKACNIAGKKLVLVGYKMMGDINELPNVIRMASERQKKILA